MTQLTKVCQLQLSGLADEQVLRLDVPVQDPSAVTVGKTSEQLEQEQLHILGIQSALILLQVLRKVRVLQKGGVG